MSCEVKPFETSKAKFEPPSLEIVLKQSDGQIQHTCMHVTNAEDAKKSDLLDPSLRCVHKQQQNAHINSHYGLLDSKLEGPRRTEHEEKYWREVLEKWLESLTVNLFIMCLVLVDVVNFLITVSPRPKLSSTCIAITCIFCRLSSVCTCGERASSTCPSIKRALTLVKPRLWERDKTHQRNSSSRSPC